MVKGNDLKNGVIPSTLITHLAYLKGFLIPLNCILCFKAIFQSLFRNSKIQSTGVKIVSWIAAANAPVAKSARK